MNEALITRESQRMFIASILNGNISIFFRDGNSEYCDILFRVELLAKN